MSSKIGVSPSEIKTAMADLPAVPTLVADDALAAAMQVMTARAPKSTQVRVIFYRFDDGDTTEADKYQAAIQSGTLPLHDVAREVDCDLQLIELGRGTPTTEDNARAAAFGMMAAEEATGLLVVCGFGAGSEMRADKASPDQFLETASPEIAAMFGAMIAAAHANIPIIAEGAQAIAAAKALRPDLRARVFICGVDHNEAGLSVFADTEKNDTGYAALMLAALFESEHAKTKQAA